MVFHFKIQCLIFTAACFIELSLATNEWVVHKAKFSLQFSNLAEDKFRQAIWIENMNSINDHNNNPSMS